MTRAWAHLGWPRDIQDQPQDRCSYPPHSGPRFLLLSPEAVSSRIAPFYAYAARNEIRSAFGPRRAIESSI